MNNHLEHENNHELLLASRLVEDGLRASFQIHEELGPEGVEATEINQFGDTQLMADVGSEKAMVAVLEAGGLPIDVRSEELGSFTLNGEAIGRKLLAVMDGLDGSSLYKKERGQANYGTMFALFDNEDPRYEQYLAAGIMLHSVGKLLLAAKGQGVVSIDVFTGDRQQVHTSHDFLTDEALIYTDDDASVPPENSLFPYFQTNLKIWAEPLRAAGFTTKRTGSSAGYYADLALGKAMIVGESTRKGNLELATAYALVTESGGKVLDGASWSDIGERLFTEYGQNSHEPFVAVANEIVATQLREIVDTAA